MKNRLWRYDIHYIHDIVNVDPWTIKTKDSCYIMYMYIWTEYEYHQRYTKYITNYHFNPIYINLT